MHVGIALRVLHFSAFSIIGMQIFRLYVYTFGKLKFHFQMVKIAILVLDLFQKVGFQNSSCCCCSASTGISQKPGKVYTGLKPCMKSITGRVKAY